MTLLLAAAALALGGCTHFYAHAYRVEPSQPLTEQELHEVFVKFKAYLIAKGMREAPGAKADVGDHVAFVLGTGKSGLMREPFEDYLQLSYTADKGFRLNLVRLIDHPVDFSDAYLADFKSNTEQFIHEATSKQVHLVVIETHGR